MLSSRNNPPLKHLRMSSAPMEANVPLIKLAAHHLREVAVALRDILSVARMNSTAALRDILSVARMDSTAALRGMLSVARMDSTAALRGLHV